MKRLLFTSLIFAIALVAKADVLYWMVSDDAYDTYKSAITSDPFAKLMVTTTDNLSGTMVASATGDAVADAYDYGDKFAYTVESTYTSNPTVYSFYVELANGMRTEAMSYNDLVNNGYVYRPGLSVPTALSPTGFGQSAATGTYSVPEPTSGLLFVIGGMLLGLKRKRQV